MSSDSAPPAASARWELWARLALGLPVLGGALMLYLASRPGGDGALTAWRQGVPALGLTAGALGVVGLVVSMRRKPLSRRGRMPAFFCVGLVLWAASSPLPYPSSHEGRPSGVAFGLPVEGEWTVRNGGEVGRSNLLEVLPDRRWGLELVQVREGRTSAVPAATLADWFCFGADVLAPAAGEVVSVVEHQADRLPGGSWAGGEELGNLVVLRVAEGQFAFLYNLQQDSIAVEVGERVAPGQVLARVGNSGRSRLTPEPHLGLHLQDTPAPGWGEAIPWSFWNYLANGRPVARGLPRGSVGADGSLSGERIQAQDPLGP